MAFNPTAYLAANPDLAAAGVTTAEDAFNHYKQYGQHENRPGSGITAPSVADRTSVAIGSGYNTMAEANVADRTTVAPGSGYNTMAEANAATNDILQTANGAAGFGTGSSNFDWLNGNTGNGGSSGTSTSAAVGTPEWYNNQQANYSGRIDNFESDKVRAAANAAKYATPEAQAEAKANMLANPPAWLVASQQRDAASAARDAAMYGGDNQIGSQGWTSTSNMFKNADGTDSLGANGNLVPNADFSAGGKYENGPSAEDWTQGTGWKHRGGPNSLASDSYTDMYADSLQNPDLYDVNGGGFTTPKFDVGYGSNGLANSNEPPPNQGADNFGSMGGLGGANTNQNANQNVNQNNWNQPATDATNASATWGAGGNNNGSGATDAWGDFGNNSSVYRSNNGTWGQGAQNGWAGGWANNNPFRATF